jgi:hypothetical protein
VHGRGFGTVNSRIRGIVAAAISLAALSERHTGSSMFDWPAHNQTSPTSTSRNDSRRVPAVASRVYGPPAPVAGQLPASGLPVGVVAPPPG